MTGGGGGVWAYRRVDKTAPLLDLPVTDVNEAEGWLYVSRVPSLSVRATLTLLLEVGAAGFGTSAVCVPVAHP
jgi:hypothetical protein